MNLKELVPWNRSRQPVPARRNDGDPVGSLQSSINRAFEDFWRALDLPMLGNGDGGTPARLPRVDVRDSRKAIEVSVELPGMDDKDVEVSLAPGALTIRGEHRSERDEEDQGYVLRERSIGVIERTVPLPDGLALDDAKATFRNGVLTVAIPKTPEAQAASKRIPVRKS
jgi:HSP20 family protein